MVFQWEKYLVVAIVIVDSHVKMLCHIVVSLFVNVVYRYTVILDNSFSAICSVSLSCIVSLGMAHMGASG